MSERAFSMVSFQVVWLACVLGAAYGSNWLGPTLVAVLAIYLKPPESEWWLMLFALLLGLILDSTFAALGVFSFATSPWPEPISPPWMLALWANLGLALSRALSWLSGRYYLAGLFGATAGPLSYLAGARLGAITIHWPVLPLFAILGGIWAITMPTLFLVGRKKTS